MCPTYRYLCSKCGHTFDELQDLKDKTLTYCVKCDADTLEKVITGSQGIHFKGGGWAADGYKSTQETIIKQRKKKQGYK